MIHNIADIIKEFKGISHYKINKTVTDSYELFFVHNSLETVRSTSTTDTTITVYAEHDGMLGDANLTVYPSTTEAELRAKLALALEKALLVDNQMYTLPSCEELCREIPSNFTDYEPKALAAMVADAVFSADTEEKGSINALEVFINKITVSVQNSSGINKSETKYVAMVEAIPTWNGEDSVELYKFFKFSDFNKEAVKSEISQAMAQVKSRGIAQKPQTPINCSMVLNTQELAELFYNISGELSYSAVYTSQNAYSKGDNLQKNLTGDLLSITMRGKIQGSPDSALFDADGVTLTDTQIVKDGIAVNYHGTNRYGQYLGEKPTGILRCIEVECGTLTDDEMKKTPYIECISMSGLQVDIYNDYIGGEVRLGYYYDGNEVKPVTGISVAGKLSEALASARLSCNKVVKESYFGPEKALFAGITVI